MAAIAWFYMVVGVAILLLWAFLLVTTQVPEVAEGDRAIWFHIVAEALLGATLLLAGFWLLSGPSSGSRLLAGIAAGGLVYSTINSSGYYANRGQWVLVGVFGLLTTAAIGTIAALIGGA